MHSDDKPLDLCHHNIFRQSEGLSDFLIGPELPLKVLSKKNDSIIPMYFTVSDVKYLHMNTIKESVVRHSLTVEAVQELGGLATP